MRIRDESKKDTAAVRALNIEAFGTPSEANLVDALRKQMGLLISLVAEQDEQILGHILFSPVSLSGHTDLKIMGLGPMAVAPPHQRKGIGSQLVPTGLKKCKQLDYIAVVVLGHPDFYPRFGFVPSSHFDIDYEYDVPEEVFMAAELVPGSLRGKSGRVKYNPAFKEFL